MGGVWFIWNHGVSILVFLEVPLQPVSSNLPDSSDSVSILVFLEVPLQLIKGVKLEDIKLRFQSLFFWKSRFNFELLSWGLIFVEFQSLFFWKSRFNHFFTSLIISTSSVSILVFLEVPLQLDGLVSGIGDYISFNPCFSGSPASTKVLVFIFVGSVMFQSLFFWKSRFNIITLPVLLMSYIVSILVFLEVPLQPYKISSVRLTHFCFNPCFSGSPASTNNGRKRTVGGVQFQSLFFWKSRFNLQGNALAILWQKFQSLFFWKSRFNCTTRNR